MGKRRAFLNLLHFPMLPINSGKFWVLIGRVLTPNQLATNSGFFNFYMACPNKDRM